MFDVMQLIGFKAYRDLKKLGAPTDVALRPVLFSTLPGAANRVVGVAFGESEKRRQIKRLSEPTALAAQPPVTLAASANPPAPTGGDEIAALRKDISDLAKEVKRLQGYVKKNCSPPGAK